LVNTANNPAAGAGKAQPGAMQAQSQVPTTGGFRIRAKRTKDIDNLLRRFAELSFLQMSIDRDTLCTLNVESRDLKKEPALFSIIYFKPNAIDAVYTCLPTMSPKKRKLEVLRQFLNLLTLAEDCYDIEMRQVYQLLEKAISDMYEYVSTDYDRLFSLYDNLKTDSGAFSKKMKDLTDANSNLSKENYELKNKADELLLKVKSLETLSDAVLSLKIQDWLSEHKGEINVSDFSKVYNVSEARVEQMLNKLVTEGYLETKG